VSGKGYDSQNKELPMSLALRMSWIVAALALSGVVHAEGRLVVEQAWIRSAPPNTPMLAGYARLSNRGDEAISVNAVSSAFFAKASLHETQDDNGVSKMRPLGTLLLKPGASVDLAPGGKHLMLMQPRGEVKPGQKIPIELVLGSAQRVSVEFVVSDEAPAPPSP
jgi:copper(I)-binding protein